MALAMPEKSPARWARLGTVESTASLAARRVCSQLAKKWVLSLRIGPPNEAPNWFRRSGGFVFEKKLRASSASLRKYSNKLPWNSLVPDRVDSATIPPVEWPYSAA